MRKIEIGDRKIYRMEDENTLLEVEGNIYILDDNKWKDDTGKPFRNLSSIDKTLIAELEPGTKKARLDIAK